MKFRFTLLIAALLLISANSWAQDKEYTYQTFKDTRVINTYSVETLQKGLLDVRIAHRFGDFFNNWQFQNAWATFLGLENAADVGLGVEYGVTNNFMIGFHRTKGAGPLRSLLHLNAKYKLLVQTTDNSMPFSLAMAGSVSVSTMPQSPNAESLASFPNGFSDRMIYSLQALWGRKFGDRFALQISPTLVWRNLVQHFDNNILVSTGVSARIQLTKVLGILIDANLPFDAMRWDASQGFQIPLGIGFEFDTGGHVFQVNLTNSAGIEPTDYIPYTQLDWAKGQFRIGFTISRSFRL